MPSDTAGLMRTTCQSTDALSRLTHTHTHTQTHRHNAQKSLTHVDVDYLDSDWSKTNRELLYTLTPLCSRKAPLCFSVWHLTNRAEQTCAQLLPALQCPQFSSSFFFFIPTPAHVSLLLCRKVSQSMSHFLLVINEVSQPWHHLICRGAVMGEANTVTFLQV